MHIANLEGGAQRMIPPAFTNFFIASTSAGAALVGLLFVAISIAPEHTVMVGAPLARQAVATNASDPARPASWMIGIATAAELVARSSTNNPK